MPEIKLRGPRKIHFNFFGKAYCQSKNWRAASQWFPLAKPGQRVTCKNCAKYSEVGR